MIFQPETLPFPRWYGPYSPARGRNSGFRIRGGVLGATAVSDEGLEFWTARQTQGVRDLVRLVQTHWQGGRVVLLPNGFVVKPLPNDTERVLIGRANDALALTTNSCSVFDFSNLRYLTPGSLWPGPGTIGLECTIRVDGSLSSQWFRSTEYGQEQTQELLAGPNPALAEGFKQARLGLNAGRVRITVGGHVITNREGDGDWRPYYAGRVVESVYDNWERWIERRGR